MKEIQIKKIIKEQMSNGKERKEILLDPTSNQKPHNLSMKLSNQSVWVSVDTDTYCKHHFKL